MFSCLGLFSEFMVCVISLVTINVIMVYVIENEIIENINWAIMVIDLRKQHVNSKFNNPPLYCRLQLFPAIFGDMTIDCSSKNVNMGDI